MSGAPPFRRLLVANRGEVAVRVIRACREMGIEPIAVYSDADANALHVRLADRSERIGPAAPAESYLSIEAILGAARRANAEAIHPGYGFLSENAAFANAVDAAGLTFIGPSAAALEALGNKLAARQSASSVGVPVIPAVDVGPTDDVDEQAARFAGLGFPAMLKAAAGGGGRGMRAVASVDELAAAVTSARREALSAFGDGTLYIERLIRPARHVEIQLLGDRHGRLSVLGERDCSVQRRHQKLVEESPSPATTPSIRAAMADSARRVATTVAFHNAATVEFLLDTQGNHFFLEMNTRLQVEHGVTELVTGVDLVAWQIRLAAGERLPDALMEPATRGHAIQVRIYAEDPYHDFAPVSGSVSAWRMPDGPGVRVDAGVEADTPLPSEYDPLLAKLLVHAADRSSAIARLRRSLDEMLVGGVQTDAGFHRWLVDEPRFAKGHHDTGLIDELWRPGPPDDAEAAPAAVAALAGREAQGAAWLTDTPMTAVRAEDAGWARQARAEGLRR